MEDSLNEQEKQLQERLRFQVQWLGSSGIPGIGAGLCSLGRSLHGVVAVEAGIALGDFLLFLSNEINFLLTCKQEEELEKMREMCEKNQELLRENDTLKQVEPCMDTRALWQLGVWILQS